ncbi:VOC family protein [Seonamhaeicola maritimus]|uniref:Glyoxalase n=1 Tax=Seonamhaeicola maritimus TaxID=2591822 RepID=A0A5C7GMG7_9FLAO|nr:VOC family protein [Seonamhaeicola maritimus]TXG39522.1 glyoxalase [Seonamhaeicola maritimus]
MKIDFQKINHVQICIPIGEEDKGREFYCGILGLKEIERPQSLKHMGGFWLELANIDLHIGTENLEGKSKRHPAFEVKNINQVKAYLIENGVKVKEDAEIPGIGRFSFYDYWDNRIELIEKVV